jgi:hypothetical protein
MSQAIEEIRHFRKCLRHNKKTVDDCKVESTKITNSLSHLREMADKKTPYNEG